MTFKKFEFWLVTLAALIAVVVLSSIFYEEYYFPFVRENNQLPDIAFYFKTLGVRTGIVLLIYICFLFENFYVYGRLYSKKKYDLVVVLTILGLLLLLGGFFYLDSLAPDLYHNLDYIPVIVACYGGFLFFIFLKKIIQNYAPHLVPGPVKRKITGEVLLAFAIWLVIFIIVLNGNSNIQRVLGNFWALWVPCAFITVMLNIYWIIPKHEKEKKEFNAFLVKAIIVTLLLSIVFGVPFSYGGFWVFAFFISTQLIISIPLAWFIYQSNKEKIQQLLNLKKELGRTTADLQFLRSQINPHFLFNALNTLYGTALQEKSERTAEGIQKLGDMMRFMLHENVQDAIPLEKEVEYLRNYIDLQQLRTQVSAHINIEVNLNEAECQHQLAPMLLIPFVENAFKHGISLKEKSWVKVSLSCKDDKLFFDVYNSIHTQRSNDPEKNNSGIGLVNVQQRLEMIYLGQHELIVRETANEFIVHLTLTFKEVMSEISDKRESEEAEKMMAYNNSTI